MKNEDKKIKKILLLISLLPYIIFLILGIIECIKENDLYCLFYPIASFWQSILSQFNIFKVLLVLFSIGYPIYYILDLRASKKSMEKDVSNKKRNLNILFIFYIISFIPYAFIIYSVIFGIELGFFNSVTTNYGFDAFLTAIFIGSVYPVYPVLLIFQVVYTIKGFKSFTKFQKILAILMITSILLLILVPSIIYSIIA